MHVMDTHRTLEKEEETSSSYSKQSHWVQVNNKVSVVYCAIKLAASILCGLRALCIVTVTVDDSAATMSYFSSLLPTAQA